MSTRTIAGKLEQLADQVAELEELGRKVQAGDADTGLAASGMLEAKYRSWFAAALAIVPDDMKAPFRFEYEGDFFRYRIKKFLEEPRLESALYKSLEPDARITLNVSEWQYPFNDTFRGPLTAQKQFLIEAVERYGTSSATLEGLALLEQITRRLPISFAVLRRTLQGKSGLAVEDEYDVQRILHAVAVLHFEEVEDEDPTPKMAGGSSRLDFLLRQERIAVETKMVGASLSVKKLRSDLADDILFFRAHPDAGSLFIFVYDPQRKITNSAGFERDLYSDSDEFPVRVVVAS